MFPDSAPVFHLPTVVDLGQCCNLLFTRRKLLTEELRPWPFPLLMQLLFGGKDIVSKNSLSLLSQESGDHFNFAAAGIENSFTAGLRAPAALSLQIMLRQRKDNPIDARPFDTTRTHHARFD
jgi:hypothetical protein